MIEIKGEVNTVKIYSDTLRTECMTEIMDLCNCNLYKKSNIILMPNYYRDAYSIQNICIKNITGLDRRYIRGNIGDGSLAVKTLDTKQITSTNIVNLMEDYDSICSTVLKDKEELGKGLIEELSCTKENKEDFTELGIQMIEGFLADTYLEICIGRYGENWIVIDNNNLSIGSNIADYYRYIADTKNGGQLRGLDLANYKSDMDVAVYYGDLLRERLCYAVIGNLDLVWGYSVKTITNYIDCNNTFRLGGVEASYRRRAMIPIKEDERIIVVGIGNKDWGETLPRYLLNSDDIYSPDIEYSEVGIDSILNTVEINEKVNLIGRYSLSEGVEVEF